MIQIFKVFKIIQVLRSRWNDLYLYKNDVKSFHLDRETWIILNTLNIWIKLPGLKYLDQNIWIKISGSKYLDQFYINFHINFLIIFHINFHKFHQNYWFLAKNTEIKQIQANISNRQIHPKFSMDLEKFLAIKNSLKQLE